MRWSSFIAGAVSGLVLLALVGWAYVGSGNYDVSAAGVHSGPVTRIMHGTMENSVRAKATGIEAPVKFTAAQIAAGAAEYKSMCESCHGGPGAKARYWIEGMNPLPPDLTMEADEWSSAELFWIVRNGIKMTGMPAFGPTHDDETVWNIAAFVQALPTMSAADYAGYAAEDDGDHHEDEADKPSDASRHVDPPGTPPHGH